MVEPSTSIVSAATHESASLSPDGAGLRRPSWLDGFRRITTSGQFIPEIDGLRFVAISLVILHHVALYISIRQQRDEGLFSLGQHGVELFFAISGFILAVPFALQHLRGNRPVRLRSYFWRRFTRIEPPYLLSLILLTAVSRFRSSRGFWNYRMESALQRVLRAWFCHGRAEHYQWRGMVAGDRDSILSADAAVCAGVSDSPAMDSPGGTRCVCGGGDVDSASSFSCDRSGS